MDFLKITDSLKILLSGNMKLRTCILLFLLLLLFILFVVLKRKKRKGSAADDGDEDFYLSMDGLDFEEYCAKLLKKNGFTEVEMTPKTADFGVDIFAEKSGITYAFQCKRYDHPVGTKAVQEIYAGRDFYHCMVGVVITNNDFTSGALKMAEAFNIILWGKEELAALEADIDIE